VVPQRNQGKLERTVEEINKVTYKRPLRSQGAFVQSQEASMGNWQKQHLIAAGLVGALLFFAWGLIARQEMFQKAKDALACVDKQGSSFLTVQNVLEGMEERIRSEGKDTSPLFAKDYEKLREAVKPFISASVQKGCPQNAKTDILEQDFSFKPLEEQRQIVEGLIAAIIPDFKKQIEISKPLAGLIFSGLLINLLVSFLLTALVNRLVIRRLRRNAEGTLQKLLEEYKSKIQRFPFINIMPLVANNPLLADIKRDVEQLERQNRVESRPLDFNGFDVSRILFKVGSVAKEKKQSELEHQVREVYLHVRKILQRQLIIKVIGLLNVITFLLVFAGIVWLWHAMGIGWLDEFFPQWLEVVAWLACGIGVVQVLMPLTEYALRWFTEKTWTDFDDLAVGVLGGPLVASALAAIAYLLIAAIPGYAKFFIQFVWAQLNSNKLSQALLTVIIGWLLVFILNKVIVYALLKWSERTEQKYDDMFVRIIQVFGTFILIAVIFGILLANFQSDIARVTGVDNVLLPYSIIVSVFSAILGFASREAIENFFGGILLQVDRPFRLGERLKLEGGEICDVREIGMRSTVLYNVVESTEISIPNSLMANMKVTNISRPDYSLRLAAHLVIPRSGVFVKKVESILLDIGYLEGEVDQARITDEEVGTPQRAVGRRSVIEELNLLVRAHPQIQSTTISRIEGGGRIDEQPVFPQIYERLERIRAWRIEYANTVQGLTEKFEHAAQQLSLGDSNESGFISFTRELDLALYQEWGTKGRIDPERIKRKRLDEIVHAVASQFKLIENKDLTKVYDALKDLTGVREKRTIILNLTNLLAENATIRLGLISQIASEFSVISELVIAIANSHSLIRSDLDRLINELNKEPIVLSTNNSLIDKPFVELEFGFFATFMERQDVVLYKVSKAIRRRLWREGIFEQLEENKNDKPES
jgi:small-conductance mechanosensitive channel